MTVDLGMLRRLVADSVEHTGKDEVWIKKDVLLELICENERHRAAARGTSDSVLDRIRNPALRVAATLAIGAVSLVVYLVAFPLLCTYETLRGFARGDEAGF